MNTYLTVTYCSITLIALLSPRAAAATNLVARLAQSDPQHAELQIRSRFALPVSSMRAEYTIHRSSELQNWEPLGSPLKGEAGCSEELLRQVVPLDLTRAFYRISTQVSLADAAEKVGPAIYGFGTAFGQRLERIGQIPLQNFVQVYAPPSNYLEVLTFCPTNAEYWSGFSTNSKFQLNSDEQAMFNTNAFVVSQRLGSHSFPDIFYNVFTADLPVYISCDSVLHAWHRSYVNLLEELEEGYLSTRLDQILSGMASRVYGLWTQSEGTPLANGFLDADYFLAVARSLITGTTDYGSLGQIDRVFETTTAISNLQPAVAINLFGSERQIDFTQFKVRGHYETSQRLARYFRVLMWCGMIDFRFTGKTNDNSLRELSGAVAMHLLLKSSGQFTAWKQMDDVIRLFVGPPDALNFAQLSDLLAAAGIQSPADLPDEASLRSLHASIMAGDIGVQNIQSGYFWSPLSSEQIKLPRSFAFMPTRFTLDAWTLNQCVFDRIVWIEAGVPSLSGKIMRRVPSALDVAFSVFANNASTPLIADRIASHSGHAWRDGRPYQHNLAAVRQVIDSLDHPAWTDNLYLYWLACLRELSGPTTAAEYPDAMRTRQWAMKTLNTQLASWTELKHDTILYAKQPYTGNIVCSYPQGFVEPRVSFWETMRNMALRARALLSALPQTGQFTFEPNTPYESPITVTVSSMYQARLAFLDNFATRMATLRDISAKELARQALSSAELSFLEGLIEQPGGYTGTRTFSGWYPGLFYANVRATHSGALSISDLWDALVTDVHTDPADIVAGDPGCILHEAVGNAGLLVISVNWGPGDACVYAGPVLSHYEFELPPDTRKTDSEWKSELKAGLFPPAPPWTSGYQVPGNIAWYPWN